MSFLETPSFPLSIAYGSSGGPGFKTTIIVTSGGAESRNMDWEQARHEYDAASGVISPADLESLIAFFQAVGGRAHGFRWKDFADYKSCALADTVAATDQTLGTGDDAEVDFQLVKAYTAGALTRSREITKPISGTVVVSIDDVTQGSGWTVDTTTGIVTFDVAPAVAEVVKAGFQFEVPCRFDTDRISAVFTDYEQRSTSVPIVEIRV